MRSSSTHLLHGTLQRITCSPKKPLPTFHQRLLRQRHEVQNRATDDALVDVAIIGAGPAGLALAVGLKEKGVRVKVSRTHSITVHQYDKTTLRFRKKSRGNLTSGKTLFSRSAEAYLVTLTDRCSFLCVSGQRGTIAKSMHEEHLCVVALTSMERGTQFFPLASCLLV